MFLQQTSCSSLVTEIGRALTITALCQKSSRKMLILSDNSAPPDTAHTAKTLQTVATAESSFTNSSVIPA